MSDDSSKHKKTQPQALTPDAKQWGIPGALFFGTLAFLLPEAILYSIASSLTLLALSQNEQSFVAIILYELFLVSTVVLVVYAYGKKIADLGIGSFRIDYLWRAVLAFILYIPLSEIIMRLAGIVFPYDAEQAQPVGFVNPQGWLEPTLIFIGLVLIVPLAEELLFRGFIFAGFRKRLSFWVTSVCVSLLFAVVHGQVNVALDVFSLSLVLCYLREKTQSLWPSILLHVAKNGVAFWALLQTGFTG
ncbi:MAG TPA: type II CAAX endopeptidase family protein [Candidatus Saccharimonadales bacterium]|nr:type II CAAX endopeptidase family protein [Candidatus Saccharimonadales bacterium]